MLLTSQTPAGCTRQVGAARAQLRPASCASSSARCEPQLGRSAVRHAVHTRDVRLEAASTMEPSTAPSPSTSSPPAWYEKNARNMKEVKGVQELVDALAEAGDNLVIVDFYAPWCGACRALHSKLCKLMEQYPDIVFLKVNFEENRPLCKTLGVKVLPYFHFYHGAQGRVAAFSCTVSKLQRMRDALDEFHTPICSLEPFQGLLEFPDVVAHPLDGEVSQLDHRNGNHVAGRHVEAAEQLPAMV